MWTIIKNHSPRAQFLSTHRSVRLHGSSNLYQQSPTARSIFEHAPIRFSPSREANGSPVRLLYLLLSKASLEHAPIRFCLQGKLLLFNYFVFSRFQIHRVVPSRTKQQYDSTTSTTDTVPHDRQQLSSFSAACEAPFFPFCLRSTANKLHGYIYSALATYFYAVIYLHQEDIDGHLLRLYNF